MEYLIQHAVDAPMDTIGVPVTLFATDSSGATTQIGQVTSTGPAEYSTMLWTPPAKGEYVITAAFSWITSIRSIISTNSSRRNSSSHTSRYTNTNITPTPIVSPTPSPIVTPTPTTPQGPGGIPASTIYAIAAAVVVIVIVAVAAVALRKRK